MLGRSVGFENRWLKIEQSLFAIRARSDDQHRVAIAEETVFASDGLGVDFSNPLDAVGRTGREKSGNETEQGGAWLVKVGDQRVDSAKRSWRIDKDACFTHVGMILGRSVS